MVGILYMYIYIYTFLLGRPILSGYVSFREGITKTKKMKELGICCFWVTFSGAVFSGLIRPMNRNHEPSLRTGVGKNHSNFHVCNDLESSNCLDLIRLPGFVEVVDSIQEKNPETACCHYEESICRLSMCAYWRTKGFAVCTCGAAGWKFVSPILWSQNFIVVIPWPKHRLFLGWMIPNPRKNLVLSPEIHEEIYSISCFRFCYWIGRSIIWAQGFPICNILHSSTFQGCKITIRPIVFWWPRPVEKLQNRKESFPPFLRGFIHPRWVFLGTSVASAALPSSKSRQNPPRQQAAKIRPRVGRQGRAAAG